MRHYPGSGRLELVLDLPDGQRVRCGCEEIGIEVHPEMRRRVEELLGEGNFRPLISQPKAAAPPPQRPRQFAGRD